MTAVGSFTPQQSYFLLRTDMRLGRPVHRLVTITAELSSRTRPLKKIIFTVVSGTHKHSAWANGIILCVSRSMSANSLVTCSVDSVEGMWKELAERLSV